MFPKAIPKRAGFFWFLLSHNGWCWPRPISCWRFVCFRIQLGFQLWRFNGRSRPKVEAEFLLELLPLGSICGNQPGFGFGFGSVQFASLYSLSTRLVCEWTRIEEDAQTGTKFARSSRASWEAEQEEPPVKGSLFLLLLLLLLFSSATCGSKWARIAFKLFSTQREPEDSWATQLSSPEVYLSVSPTERAQNVRCLSDLSRLLDAPKCKHSFQQIFARPDEAELLFGWSQWWARVET